jgi:hypothetical protein
MKTGGQSSELRVQRVESNFCAIPKQLSCFNLYIYIAVPRYRMTGHVKQVSTEYPSYDR